MKRYVLSLIIGTICSLHTFTHLDAQENENQKIEMIPHATPDYLYKIISPEQWEQSLLQHEIAISSLDEDFIHLAKEDQVASVVQKFWNNKNYIVLKLVSKKLVGRLIYEANPGGSTQYYHLYEGNIPLDAVVNVTTVVHSINE